ncbi:MAG: CoB--CoM heterodisulfide reductase iron-sulfur subunit A family protein [Desulfurococcales archaeon]|nr:CoB--CoM heterodisulfide reductase iron-sulfur subunit A family protein [Desulfurococcales archaeon]
MSGDGKDIRIGVYVCWCGGNISDVVDVEKVVNVIKNEEGVIVARHFMFMCSEAGQKMIENDIKTHNLNAVVVASCSPKLHELTFRNTVLRAGINPYMYYHANIREQVSWAHSDSKEEATKKAIRHIRMAIAYLRHAEPLEKIKVEATPAVLIIGGGVTGLRAAIDLARAGVNVYLVEKEPFLGGHVARLGETYPSGRPGWELVSRLIDELLKHDNVAIYTKATVERVEGYIGNFDVTIKVSPRYFVKNCERIEEAISRCNKRVPDEWSYGVKTRTPILLPPYPGAYPRIPALDMKACGGDKCMECLEPCKDAVDLAMQEQVIKLKVGAVITATGFNPYEPSEGEFGYKQYPYVITLPQFNSILKESGNGKLVVNGKEVKSLAFIYCVGSRQREGRTYCSRYCCNATIYAALLVAKKFPGVKQYHFYRDIRTYGKNELMYEQASRSGAVFIKYPEEEPPKVTAENGSLLVRSRDLLTEGLTIDVSVDLVVLVTGMVPRNNKDLNELLKLPLGKDGFYQEVHPKLRPVETTLSGFLIAGTAQGPKDTLESLSSGSAAAAKAGGIVLKRIIELEPFRAFVDPDKCELTRQCVAECPYMAISVKNYEGKGEKAWVNPAICKGCGACVAVCPNNAIQIKGLTNDQVVDMIKAAAREV